MSLKTGKQRRQEGRQAFTLVELLVCVTVVSVLAALLAPALEGARRAARSAVCLSNQRQLVLMSQLYSDDNAGYLVHSRGYYEGGREKIWTWALAPYWGGAGEVALCPETGPAELPALYGEDWEERDRLNIGINRNLETQPGCAGGSKCWLPVPPGSWPLHRFAAPPKTWYFGDSYCGLRGFQCQLGWQVDGQSSFSTRHDGCVQLGFLDGHAEAVPAGLLTDEAGITIADNDAGVWWFPWPCEPGWVVP